MVLHTSAQTFLGANYLKKDVARILANWHEDGRPLTLTEASFKQVLGLAENGEIAPVLFQTFDTDQNGKVDFGEVISAVVMLAQGPLDAKIEMLFPIFDFSNAGRVSFDEAQIMIQCICKGLEKVCELPMLSDPELIEASRQMFDAHNMPYSQEISKDQVKRWQKADMEASQFLDAINSAFVLGDVRKELQRRADAQVAAYREIESSGGEASLEELHDSAVFRQTLQSPSREVLQSAMTALKSASKSGKISSKRFSEAIQAWNAFAVLDHGGSGHLPSKELRNLIWLTSESSHAPSANFVDEVSEDLKLKEPGQEKISMAAWLTRCQAAPLS